MTITNLRWIVDYMYVHIALLRWNIYVRVHVIDCVSSLLPAAKRSRNHVLKYNA